MVYCVYVGVGVAYGVLFGLSLVECNEVQVQPSTTTSRLRHAASNALSSFINKSTIPVSTATSSIRTLRCLIGCGVSISVIAQLLMSTHTASEQYHHDVLHGNIPVQLYPTNGDGGVAIRLIHTQHMNGVQQMQKVAPSPSTSTSTTLPLLLSTSTSTQQRSSYLQQQQRRHVNNSNIVPYYCVAADNICDVDEWMHALQHVNQQWCIGINDKDGSDDSRRRFLVIESEQQCDDAESQVMLQQIQHAVNKTLNTNDTNIVNVCVVPTTSSTAISTATGVGMLCKLLLNVSRSDVVTDVVRPYYDECGGDSNSWDVMISTLEQEILPIAPTPTTSVVPTVRVDLDSAVVTVVEGWLQQHYHNDTAADVADVDTADADTTTVIGPSQQQHQHRTTSELTTTTDDIATAGVDGGNATAAIATSSSRPEDGTDSDDDADDDDDDDDDINNINIISDEAPADDGAGTDHQPSTHVPDAIETVGRTLRASYGKI